MIKIGTRGSKLAMWQAEHFQQLLNEINIESSIIVLKTKGDRIQNLSFDKIEGKGFFTKEIEDALLAEEIDVAVHSLKDLPTESPEGLVIAGLSSRANPADLLLIREDSYDEQQPFKLKKGSIVGTSSQRRKSLVRYFRPDISLKDIRGNVPTRIQKLKDGNFDAIVIAKAGVDRINARIEGLHSRVLNPKEFISAPGQGVIAFQTREGEIDIRKMLGRLSDKNLVDTVNVERKVLKLLEGGCHMPIGVYCEKDDLGNFHVWSCYGNNWKDDLNFVQYSSNTKFELAETIANKLK
ncbi:hydroxymethylbilane synthase [Membranihabitans maritimus]|uniref:hydroxymethylbilane synthase n=1 Tax=Membranihabitans maritimus TaxID=2904244 RepID=UPI001F0200D3|nr:hydroxymethylbilane synthase [Membranihabitans maritimus]